MFSKRAAGLLTFVSDNVKICQLFYLCLMVGVTKLNQTLRVNRILKNEKYRRSKKYDFCIIFFYFNDHGDGSWWMVHNNSLRRNIYHVLFYSCVAALLQ